MRGGVVRVEKECLANPLHGKVIVAGLVGNDAEEVECSGMVGLDGKDAPVERLGLRQSPGLMVLEGQGEGLWDRDHGSQRRLRFPNTAPA